jgi:hypothetical protein
MLIIPSSDCDECVPDYARSMTPAAYFSYAVFFATFTLAAGIAYRRLLPLLSGDASAFGLGGPVRSSTIGSTSNTSLKEALDATTNATASPSLPLHEFEFRRKPAWKGMIASTMTARRFVSLVFCASLGLSAVLVELLLCEISGFLDSHARRRALGTVLPMLTFLLIVVAPALEIQSLLAALGLKFAQAGKHKVRFAWTFEFMGLMAWLAAFWFVGEAVLRMFLRDGSVNGGHGMARKTSFGEGCLERIGVIGISLMASLGGFAAVSATWQTLIMDRPNVTEPEIERKQVGLDATEEMLAAKKGRLRALERKMSSETSTASGGGRGVWGTVMGTLRGGATDSKERATLELEINGLESMRLSLQDTLYMMKSRKAEQERAHTFAGSMTNLASLLLAIYMAFRLASVAFTVSRRFMLTAVSALLHPHGAHLVKDSTPHDPVSMLLTVLANHWDPTLDRAAWTRQISFLLSGIMLLAALNSALQTFLLLARAFPGLAASAASFRDATTLALLVSQVVGAYVVSGALMLRSNLPGEVGSAISEALGGTPLPPARVDAWFEVWFLGAAAVTALGIWAGRRMRLEEEDEETTIGDPEKGNMKTS